MLCETCFCCYFHKLPSFLSAKHSVSSWLPPWATTSNSIGENPRRAPRPLLLLPKDSATPPGLIILMASFLFFTWLSGKIYRVGILMYGKKVTWKELYKWLSYKG